MASTYSETLTVEVGTVKSHERRQYVWKNVFLLLVIHVFAVHGLYFWLTFQISRFNVFWGLFVAFLCGQGITSGAHRLWAHRTYKAKLPLQILLCFCQTMCLQTPIYDWVRDHRVHHKYTDTDADPHNASRGFFFAHMGWLMVRKHREVLEKGRKLDMSDVKDDPIVRFQKKYHLLLGPVLALLLPPLVPWYCSGDSFYVCWCSNMLRYVLILHGTWSVNSVAHFWGNKPYDQCIKPTENLVVAIFAMGEGWHNYHHVFPWDYKTGELGSYGTNLSTGFIDLMAKIGWAYDLKTASPEMILKRKKKTGPKSQSC